jgi:hypothetical protein
MKGQMLAAVTSFLLFLFVFFVSSAQVVVAEETAHDLLTRSSFTTGERQSLQTVFETARRTDIPEAFLLPRLQEGIAKRIDAARLAVALENDLTALQTVRDTARSVPGGDSLLADGARWARGATLLAAGRTPGELRDLMALTVERPDSFRAAAVLYLSLIEWGLSSGESFRIVEAAVASLLPPESFAGIGELFTIARRERIRPERMVERVILGLERADSLRVLRTIVVD